MKIKLNIKRILILILITVFSRNIFSMEERASISSQQCTGIFIKTIEEFKNFGLNISSLSLENFRAWYYEKLKNISKKDLKKIILGKYVEYNIENDFCFLSISNKFNRIDIIEFLLQEKLIDFKDLILNAIKFNVRKEIFDLLKKYYKMTDYIIIDNKDIFLYKALIVNNNLNFIKYFIEEIGVDTYKFLKNCLKNFIDINLNTLSIDFSADSSCLILAKQIDIIETIKYLLSRRARISEDLLTQIKSINFELNKNKLIEIINKELIKREKILHAVHFS